jgi:hypothetical protein
MRTCRAHSSQAPGILRLVKGRRSIRRNNYTHRREELRVAPFQNHGTLGGWSALHVAAQLGLNGMVDLNHALAVFNGLDIIS